MQRFFFLYAGIISIFLLTACSQSAPVLETADNQTPKDIKSEQISDEDVILDDGIESEVREEEKKEEVLHPKQFFNEALGISFDYSQGWVETNLLQDGNKIVVSGSQNEHFIEVLTKEKDVSIKSAIFDIAARNGARVQKCRLVSGPIQSNGLQEYFLDLAEPIVFSAEERRKLEEAHTNPQGVVDREWVEKALYQAKIEENCSIYAQTNEPSTCIGARAKFYYNPQQSQTRFIFAPPQVCQTSFYKYGSFEFL